MNRLVLMDRTADLEQVHEVVEMSVPSLGLGLA